MLTSGTTGAPKGARRPTPAGFGPLISIIDRIPLHARDRILIAAPLFHTWGYAALQVVLRAAGDHRAAAPLRPRRHAARPRPARVRRAVRRTGDAAAAAGGRPPKPLPPLKVVAVSGSALPGGLATAFMDVYGDVLYNLYGSTEVSWASIATPADLRQDPGTAGRPPHGTRWRSSTPTGRPVPRGRGRADLRRQRDALRGLHLRHQPGDPRRAARAPATSATSTPTGCSSSTAGPTT